MRYALVAGLSFSILGGAITPAAFVSKGAMPAALATRTWVSGIGNDANACSRSLPCLTFDGAFTKTAAGGEIDCLDPGSFGGLTITKAITIDCNGVVGGVVTGVGGTGIDVFALNTDLVILRNLEINGDGTGSIGILFEAGKQLVVENTRIFGWTTAGIAIIPTSAGFGARNLVVSNSTISSVNSGGNGISTATGVTTVSHSVIFGNAIGLIARFSGVVNADSNVLTNNGIAVQAGFGGAQSSSAIVRLSNNDVYGNLTGFYCDGGVLASAGNNRKGNNTGGTVTPCAPSATVTQQ